MDNKTYTVLISTNRRGKTRSLSISAAWVKTAGFLLGVVIVVSGAVLVDYLGLLLQAGENKKLKAERGYLRKQFQVVESKLSTLERSLEHVKNFSKKLKIITNIDDIEDRSVDAALSMTPSLGEQNYGFLKGKGLKGNLPLNQLEKDALFLKNPPLNHARGELSLAKGKDYALLSVRIDKAVKNTQLREQSVLELWETLSERQNLLNATPSLRPTRGWFTSKFGYRLDPFTSKPTMHNGLDLAASPGTPIYAPSNGVVSYVGYESGYGKLISIDHGYGVVTRYAHTSQVYVQLGQKVTRRDVIAAVGNTGRSSGPHLHYEVRIHGMPVDPMNYILGQ
ncbi:MAG: M23 family metallopeptidase [Bdellovibrionaceae bacterium]|jgi:murein DD-endopeptidase MepM/ murein hydrolase activator NlpD|nr:M23 family metallopeptidase [Pseudobdellovibrionaceae bacterium]